MKNEFPYPDFYIVSGSLSGCYKKIYGAVPNGTCGSTRPLLV